MTGYGSFDPSFGAAFDAIVSAQPVQPVSQFIAERAPTGVDPGRDGDTWYDVSHIPVAVYVHYDAGGLVGWHLAGEFRQASTYASSHRLWEACLLLALRNYQVMNAPLGLAGGYDIGAVYVGRIDADYSRLIKNYRGQGVPLMQEWPTLDDVAARMQMSSGAAAGVDLQRALDAAVEQVTTDTAHTFGVG